MRWLYRTSRSSVAKLTSSRSETYKKRKLLRRRTSTSLCIEGSVVFEIVYKDQQTLEIKKQKKCMQTKYSSWIFCAYIKIRPSEEILIEQVKLSDKRKVYMYITIYHRLSHDHFRRRYMLMLLNISDCTTFTTFTSKVQSASVSGNALALPIVHWKGKY